jgi:hypothetical protein
MIRDLFQILQHLKTGGPGPLGDVQKGLDERPQGQVPVPGVKKHVFIRKEHRAQGLAFAAPDAMGNVHGQVVQ